MKNIDIIKSLPNHKLLDFINMSLGPIISKNELLEINDFLLNDNPHYIDDPTQEYIIEKDFSKKTLAYNINKYI